jgi:choline dehydrogenase
MLGRQYDFIVVGAGSGGCVMARRLVENSDATVLLIEAGPADLDVPEIDTPSSWASLGRGPYDWGYDYAPTPRVNGRVIGLPRGKVLGGSSAINALMWYRGNPRDYDAWAAAGSPGWSFADCLPYFRRCEDWEGGASDLRGIGGPLRIERSHDLHPIAQALIDGAGALGIPVIDDPNGPSNEGATRSNFNIRNGKRWSSAQGYLRPILGNPRISVLTESRAVGLIFQGARCVGVRHRIGRETRETSASSGVVLALGAIDTPRLLMLSGIGDPQDLRSLGLKVRTALPGVGSNLQDHPLILACNFRSKRPMGPLRDNGGGSMINWKSAGHMPQADVHAVPIQGAGAEHGLSERYRLNGDIFAIATGLMRSRSVGFMRLRSADPDGALEIQPNFLAEPSDLDALVTAVGTVLDLAQTKAFEGYFDGFAAPDRRLDRKGTIDFIRNACSTFFHTCGTCAMGSDERAVVDPQLRVRGIDRLTIADASVIPVIPSCNTHAPVTMIAERAASFLLNVVEPMKRGLSGPGGNAGGTHGN